MINIGEQLQNARVAKQLSIEEAATQTKVSTSTLTRYENNDFGIPPLTVYTKGHLKLYCQILELDTSTILEALQQQHAEHSSDQNDNEQSYSAFNANTWLLSLTKQVNFTHIAILLLLGGWIMFIAYASHSSPTNTNQIASSQTSVELPTLAAASTKTKVAPPAAAIIKTPLLDPTTTAIKTALMDPAAATTKKYNETSND